MGGVGGLPHDNYHEGGVGGVATIFVARPGRGFRCNDPKRNIRKTFLVKYCNFVVNLDHSL
jgi:hypothetical protein